MTRDRPTYTKWTRRAGGYKVCLACHRKHPEMMRINGRPQRPKACVDCGAELPSRLTYPKKSRALWFVREFDPVTGQSKDHPCRSSDDADEFIRRKERDFTRDPIQERLLEHASTLSRQIQADTFDDAVNLLIAKLGGDPVARTLKPIALKDAIDGVCDELRVTENASELYVAETRRIAQDFVVVSGITSWADAATEHVKKYALALSAGGWERQGRRVRPVKSHTRAKCLRTLRAFVVRAIQNCWMHPRIIAETNTAAWSQATDPIEHEYLPDAAFLAVVKAADNDRWMRTLLLVAYNSAARLGDLLRLTWRDVDLDGMSEKSGRASPTVRIANTKGNKRAKVKKPLFVPLDDHVIEALRDLRANPVAVVQRYTPPSVAALRLNPDGGAADDERVFPVRGYQNDRHEVSKRVGELFVKAGFADADGGPRWTLHDLRRKANMDIQRAGASLREAMSLTGHSSPEVNVQHYQSPADLERMRVLTSNMSGFKGLRLARESA